jgi:hypothetical protein
MISEKKKQKLFGRGLDSNDEIDWAKKISF